MKKFYDKFNQNNPFQIDLLSVVNYAEKNELEIVTYTHEIEGDIYEGLKNAD